MATKRKCRACGKSFSPDYRNQKEQAFCPRAECRRIRRAEAQRKRRERASRGEHLTRRLKPSEAAWLRKNPLIIGLVSVLIGSTDWQEIESFCAAAILRGTKILQGGPVEVGQKDPQNQQPNKDTPSQNLSEL